MISLFIMYRSSSNSSHTVSKPAQASASQRAQTRFNTGRTVSSSAQSASRATASRAGTQTRRKKKRKPNGGALLLLVLSIILIVLIVILAKLNGCDFSSNDSDKPSIANVTEESYIPRGVTVSGVPVGDLQLAQARLVLENQLNPRLDGVAVTLETDYFKQLLRAAELGVSYDIDSVLYEAAAGKKNKSYDTPILINESVLAETIRVLQADVPNAAKDATITVITDSETGRSHFEYDGGVAGMTVHTDKLAADLREKFMSGTLAFTIVPEMTVSEPNITLEDAKRKTTQLNTNLAGEKGVPFITDYYFMRHSPKQTEEEVENCEGRNYNITKGVNMMNVIHLKPGEVWSFNDATGKRSEKNGWAFANAVYNESYRKETGGGICQVTTTLFNALLTSGIEVIDREPHSIPSDYVPIGRDATVDYGTKDFKFRNNTSSDLYVFIYVRLQDTSKGGSKYKKNICVEVYGEPLFDGQEYHVYVEENEPRQTPDVPIIEEDKNKAFDSPVEITRNAHDYINATCFVDLYQNGQFLRTVFTYDSLYKAIREKHVVGIMTPSPNPTDSPTPKPTETPKPATEAPVIEDEP